MNKLKIYSLIFSTVKDEARLYKYYIKNIIYSLIEDVNILSCTAWVTPLDKPSEEKGVFYKCNHVFFNAENRKELLKCTCIINPNKDILHLVIKNLVSKNKKTIEIQALNENHKYLEDIKADYNKDKNSINYTHDIITRYDNNSDDDIVNFAKSLTDFNIR